MVVYRNLVKRTGEEKEHKLCTGASPGSKMATEIRQQTISWNHPREAIGRSGILVRCAAWDISGRYHVASVLKAVRNMLPTDVRDAADSFRYMQSAHQSRPTPNPTKRGSGRPASAQCIASNSASLLSSNLFRCSMPSLSRRRGGLAAREPPQSVDRLTH